MKKNKLLMIGFLLGLLLCGCKKNEVIDTDIIQEEDMQSSAIKINSEAVEKSLQDIYQEITNKVELVSPMSMSEDYLENYYDIDISILEEYVFVVSEDPTSAETIVLFKLMNEADYDMIKDKIQLVVEEKKSEMENYLPEQFSLVERSEIGGNNSYIWLVISEHDTEINRIITYYLNN